MAVNKKQVFDPQDQALSIFGKALAHPARLAILKVLAERGGCICGELVDALPLAQSTVSQHLKELREASLVLVNLEGPRSCYCINWPAVEKAVDGMKEFFKQLEEQKNPNACKG
ncbi:MAG TPA: metalloregulator ArsR/SmtB family transcription factor [Flavihumibacter sp.]|jgi:ArsR family transcriptional regulator